MDEQRPGRGPADAAPDTVLAVARVLVRQRRVASIREAVGLSQREMADAYGLTQASVSMFETGARRLGRNITARGRRYAQSLAELAELSPAGRQTWQRAELEATKSGDRGVKT